VADTENPTVNEWVGELRLNVWEFIIDPTTFLLFLIFPPWELHKSTGKLDVGLAVGSFVVGNGVGRLNGTRVGLAAVPGLGVGLRVGLRLSSYS